MKEPFVKVNIEDQTIGLSFDPVDTNLNILCPVDSPSGPKELTRVTGPKMLRNLYNSGKAITSQSSTSLCYLRALVAHAPVYVKRAVIATTYGGRCLAASAEVDVDGVTGAIITPSVHAPVTEIPDINAEIATGSNLGIIILSKFPCENDDIKIRIVKVDFLNSEFQSATIEVTLGSITEAWTFSIDDSVLDSYGNNIHYRNVTRDSRLISIQLGPGTIEPEKLVVNDTFSIGSQAPNIIPGSDGAADEKVSPKSLATALEEVWEYEESEVFFDYISDAGMVDKSLATSILGLCDKYHSFYPASCPTQITGTDTLTTARGGIGDAFSANFVGVTQYSSEIDSGAIVLPGSFFYLIKRIDLAKSIQEFAAIYGESNGSIGITKPIKSFKLSERETLLDNQILSMKRSESGYYLNSNLTCCKKDSFLSEDGIVLMINKISQVADSYARSLIGSYNTEELRGNVTTRLGKMLNQRLRVGSGYGPESVRVICNLGNNEDVINQGKLRIDISAKFVKSIKEVIIYSQVKPLIEG